MFSLENQKNRKYLCTVFRQSVSFTISAALKCAHGLRKFSLGNAQNISSSSHSKSLKMLKKDYSKTKNACKVTFTLPKEAAQEAKEVRVVGDFNNWAWEQGLALKASKTEFSGSIELAAGRNYEFRYLIDNQRWENDWAADAYVPSPFDGINNSLISVSAIVNGELTGKSAGASKAGKPEKVAKAAAAPKAEKAPAAAKAPKAPKAEKAPAAKPTKVAADDLKKIEGVGPKIADLLKAGGIVTFADLAKAKVSAVKAILDAAGPKFQMHDPATWAEQAKLAAAGKWDELSKLQDKLKGGRK
jgi:predicted flap endonuclease-1-like 5' DNA nuclease